MTTVGNYRKNIGRNVAALRKERGWTQAFLSQIVGVSIKTIQGIENGRTWMEYDTAEKLGSALGVDTQKIFLPEGFVAEPTIFQALSKLCEVLGYESPRPKKRNDH